jgi:hypothetical protein
MARRVEHLCRPFRAELFCGAFFPGHCPGLSCYGPSGRQLPRQRRRTRKTGATPRVAEHKVSSPERALQKRAGVSPRCRGSYPQELSSQPQSSPTWLSRSPIGWQRDIAARNAGFSRQRLPNEFGVPKSVRIEDCNPFMDCALTLPVAPVVWCAPFHGHRVVN